MHFHTKGGRNKKNQLRHSFEVGFEPVAAGLKGLGGNLRIASTKPKTEVAFLVDIKSPPSCPLSLAFPPSHLPPLAVGPFLISPQRIFISFWAQQLSVALRNPRSISRSMCKSSHALFWMISVENRWSWPY